MTIYLNTDASFSRRHRISMSSGHHLNRGRLAPLTALLSGAVACGGLDPSDPELDWEAAGLESLSRIYVTPQVVNGTFTVLGDDGLVPSDPDGLDDDTQVVVMQIPSAPRTFGTTAEFAAFLLDLGGVFTEEGSDGVIDIDHIETGPIYSEAFEGTEGLLEIDDALFAHVGGATGTIEIGGVSHCVDLDEDCSNGYPSYLEIVDLDMRDGDPDVVSKREETRPDRTPNKRSSLKGKAETRNLAFWKRVRVKSKVKSEIGKQRLETNVDGTVFFFDPDFGWFTDQFVASAEKRRGRKLSAKKAKHAFGFTLTFGNQIDDPILCDRPGATFASGCPENIAPSHLGRLEHSHGICATFFGKVATHTKTFSFGDGGGMSSPCLEQGL